MNIRLDTMTILVVLAFPAVGVFGCNSNEEPRHDDRQQQQDDDDQGEEQREEQQETEQQADQNDDETEYGPPSAAHQVVLSELMKSPTQMPAHEGQWVELYNRSEEIFDLKGCELATSDGDSLEIDESIEIASEQLVTIANGDDPGFEPDYVIEQLPLDEDDGQLVLICDDELITGVFYDGGQLYPSGDGVSLVRDPDFVEVAVVDEPWLWCEGTEMYNDPDVGSPGEIPEGCPWFGQTGADDIAAVRDEVDAGDGTVTVEERLERVLVTYVRPRVGMHEAGFFVQAIPEGPALFASLEDTDTLEDAPVRAGQLIDLEVNEVDVDEHGRIHVSEFGDIDVVRHYIPPSELTVDISDREDLLDEVEAYEGRMISADLTIESDRDFAGLGYDSYEISTDGMGDDHGESLVLRFPFYHVDSLGASEGCELRVENTPMWRYGDIAQLSFWQLAEITKLDCEVPTQITDALALNATTVQVDFNRALDDVEEDGSDFVVDNGLEVLSASSHYNEVILETSPQGSDNTYYIEINDGLDDLWAGDADGFAEFEGFAPLDVAITEFMANFEGSAHDPGEYIELYNPGGQDFDLDGCELIRVPDEPGDDDSSAVYEFSDAGIDTIEQEQHLLVAAGAGAGAELEDDVDGLLPFVLRVGGDTVELNCSGEVIDRISYTGSDVERGVSRQKDIDFLGTPNTDGDRVSSILWCMTPQSDDFEYYEDAGEPKHGTPGSANTHCP